jgi:alkaline phosphatase D
MKRLSGGGMMLDRRQLLGRSATALGLLAGSGGSLAAAPLAGFTHSVASGEPGPTQVLLWTRFVGRGESRLRAELSTTPDFARVVAGGEVTTDETRDHTAKLIVSGLAPNRWYFYRFIGPDGARSPVGRTRTLPQGRIDAFNLGVFSCSNIGFGFFNAYGHAAARNDIDLMLHLGDYTYEYDRGHYPGPADMVAGREPEPANEEISLADYRARYAQYRRDPDLQAIHARFPMIAMWDDHESANDSWRDGAENHDPATEGAWSARKAAAVRAYREWMPVSDADWAEYRIGDLAALFRPEERLTARTKQVDFAAALRGQTDMAAALTRFRDTVWADSAHTLLGAEQEGWFADRMMRVAKETRWQVLAQQVNVGMTLMPAEVMNWSKSPAAAQRVGVGVAAAKLGLPFNMDSWNGYPAARSRLLRNGLDADANLVVLSGDSHNAWAFDLAEGGTAAGVEFGGHSVTSPGYESELPGVDPLAVARALVGSSPELKWADTMGRGYMIVRLAPDHVTTDWLFLDSIRRPTQRIARTHSASVAHGARKLSA